MDFKQRALSSGILTFWESVVKRESGTLDLARALRSINVALSVLFLGGLNWGPLQTA